MLLAGSNTYGRWAEASWSSRASGAGDKCRRPGSVGCGDRLGCGGVAWVSVGVGAGCCVHTSLPHLLPMLPSPPSAGSVQ